MKRCRIAGTIAVAATGLAWASGVASAAPNVVLPGSASPGTTVTVTVDQYGPCNNGIVPPPPDPVFDSTIELFDGSHNLVATGSFPGGTSVGTLPIPFATPPGAYTVEVSCAVSLGNGIFLPNNPLTITPPILIDLPPDFVPPGGGAPGGGPGGGAGGNGSSAGSASTPAATVADRPVPIQADPTITG